MTDTAMVPHTGPADVEDMLPAVADGVRWWEWTLYCLLVLVGAAIVVGPSNLAWAGAFVSEASEVEHDAVLPGDHLQIAYDLWLWRDALTTFSHGPWTDAYLYAASGVVSSQGSGWPLVLVSVPVDLIWGPVAAYNAVWYLAFVLAAVFTAMWVRSVGVGKWGAAVAGFAFAFAPFRVLQGMGHANAILAWLFPLLLLCLEYAMCGSPRTARRWAWGAAAVQVSIVLSGELHYAVFSVLLVGGYVLIRAPWGDRERLRTVAVPAAAMVLGTALVGVMQFVFLVSPSGEGGGRSVDEAAEYAPRIGDLFRRPRPWGNWERYMYPGAVAAIGGAIGAVVALWRGRRRWFALWMVVGILSVLLLAVTPGFVGHPWLQSMYRLIPGLSFSRVPGRIWILGALFLAALLGLAVDALRRRWLQVTAAVTLCALMLVDVPKGLYDANAAVAEPYREIPEGASILEFPPFGPERHHGSPYGFYVTQNPGPRLGGYNVLLKPEAAEALARTEPLVAEPDDFCLWRDVLADYDLDYVAVHRDLFGTVGARWPADAEHIIATLDEGPGFELASDLDGVAVFAVEPDEIHCLAG